MNTNLLNIVKQIIADNGEGILSDPPRLKSFFSDLAKDEPKPLRIAFGRCIQNGAYIALKTAPDAGERISRKATIAQRLRDEHGLDPALCAEALDILEAALYGSAEAPYTPPPHQQPQVPREAAPTPISAIPVTPQPAKKHTLRNVLIAAGVAVAVIAGVAVYQWHQQRPVEAARAAAQRPIELNEYGHIILEQVKNNDASYEPKLALTLKNVQDVQQFIKENYRLEIASWYTQRARQVIKENFPDFDFGMSGYIIDDYRNKLLVKSFNEGPEFAAIYLFGIEKIAGYSSVYARLLISDENDGKDILGYFYSIDEEYSDCSGIEFFSSPLPLFAGTNSDSIKIFQKKHSDTNEYYWEIYWEEGIAAKDKTAMLKSFLAKIRRARVFNNLDIAWLKDIYTGIETYQKISNLVEW